MEIKTRNTLIGAGIGAAIGSGAGAVAGIIKNKPIQANVDELKAQLSSIETDTYVQEHCKAAKIKQFKGGIKPSKIKKNMSKVIEKATQDIKTATTKLSDEIKSLSKSKNKTLIAFIGIGLATGAVIGALVGRFIPKAKEHQTIENK